MPEGVPPWAFPRAPVCGGIQDMLEAAPHPYHCMEDAGILGGSRIAHCTLGRIRLGRKPAEKLVRGSRSRIKPQARIMSTMINLIEC